MAKPRKSKTPSSRIADNKKARFDYAIEETLEAGLALEGWEWSGGRERGDVGYEWFTLEEVAWELYHELDPERKVAPADAPALSTGPGPDASMVAIHGIIAARSSRWPRTARAASASP